MTMCTYTENLTVPTGSTTTGLAYDQANRLTGYGTTATYTYDGGGLRTRKTVGGTTQAFTYETAEGLPLILGDGNSGYVYGPGGMPIEQINGSTVQYLHQDQLGSTRLITDSTGAVAGNYQFDAYGNTTSHTGTATTPLQYAGQYKDAESGLYWMRARMYDPATGQFLGRDPLTSRTREPYAYADGDGLNGTDLSGMSVWNSIQNGAQRTLSPWTNGAQQAAALASSEYKTATGSDEVRLPDYYSFDISGSALPFAPFVLGGYVLTVTRYGHVYVGPQAGVGLPGYSLAGRVGWIRQSETPSCSMLDSFVNGWSVTGGGLGGNFASAQTWGNIGGGKQSDVGNELGLGGGSVSAGVLVSHSYRIR